MNIVDTLTKVNLYDQENKARENLWLPQKMVPCKKDFESLGFTFKDIPGDPVLFQATLPDGWRLEALNATPHFTFILDDKGNKRGISYYACTSAGRCGQISLWTRFCINTKSKKTEGLEGPYKVVVEDRANESVVFVAGKCDARYGRKYEGLLLNAQRFLSERYPGWNDDPLKHWD